MAASGSGLYGILVYVAVTVFIAGLMIGRTPEYLGKKMQSYEVKMASFYLLIFAGDHPGLHRLGRHEQLGSAAIPLPRRHPSNGTNNNGPHGFTEILYAFSEAAGNNGSAFAGLSANAPWYNTTLGIAILFGRYAMMIPAWPSPARWRRRRYLRRAPAASRCTPRRSSSR